MWRARSVVVATGLFQRPRIPAFAASLPNGVVHLAAGQYRSPAGLAPGAVLVVGSGQSGCQIAEELYQHGRRVYLSVGSAGRVPRRYRGKDITRWLDVTGWFRRTVDQLPSPKAKFAANPHLSGRDGGHSLNLHRFARDGVVLLGRLQDARDGRIALAPGLRESLARVDRFEADLLKRIDEFIAKNGLDAPLDPQPELRDGFAAPELAELDLAAAGITTVIWALGYRFDFSLVKLPVFDEDGFPVTNRGVTHFPGLYFAGMPWLHTQSSGLLMGMAEDASYIAASIAESRP
jgi:putative flavoprotein involved in K+ transport